MSEFQSQTPQGQHPDEDLLAGYAESALLTSEREGVEEHLVGCSVCREIVASLAPEREQAPSFEGFEATAVADERILPGPGSPVARVLPWLLAAAALVLFFLIPPGGKDDGPPTIEIRVAEAMLAAQAEELFSTLRSPEPLSSSDQWHLGLRLDHPATVRVLAMLSDGRTMPVPLDGSGAEQLDLAADTNHAFGPYPRTFDGSTVNWLLVVAGGDDEEFDRVRTLIDSYSDASNPAEGFFSHLLEGLLTGEWEAQFTSLGLGD